MRAIAAWLALAMLLTGFGWEGRLSRLRRELASGDAAKRRAAVHQLARFSSSQIGTALLKALDDPDESVRLAALRVIGEVGLTEATPTLLDWLDDPSADLRVGAVNVLGDLRDRRATARLIRALGDSSADVRRAAVIALARIGDSESTMPLLRRLDDDDIAVRVEAATALGSLGDERAIGPLIGKVRDDAADVRAVVVRALGQIGNARAVSTLLRSLDDDAQEVRIVAVGALGDLRAEAAIDPLRALLAGNDFRLAQAAVAALGRIGTEAAVDSLVGALARDELRTLAEEALVTAAHPDAALARLAHGLVETDGAPTLANAIRRMLELHHSKEITEALLVALERTEHPVAVMMALAETGDDRALIPLLERLRGKDAAGAVDALETFFSLHGPDGRAAEPLLEALGRIELRQRPRVVRLLGAIRVARALPVLRPLLHHDDPALRQATVEAIGAIGDPAGATLLLELLSSDDARTRFDAAHALASAADPATVDELVQRLDSRKPFDRHAALIALGGAAARLGDRLDDVRKRRMMDVLKKALRSRDPRLVARAIDAAMMAKPPGLEGLLIDLATTRFDAIGRQALFALGAFDSDDARRTLRSTLQRRDPTMASIAASALGENGDATDVDGLLKTVESGSWPSRPAASFALARLARRGLVDRSRAPALCEFARSRDSLVVANVLVALAELRARCADGLEPSTWLSRLTAQPAHRAASLWGGSIGEGSSTCKGGEDCATLPPLDSHADIYAYRRDRSTPIVGGLIALAFSDGTILVGYSDANAHLLLEHVPSGTIELLDPATTPLLSTLPSPRPSR